MGLTRPERGLAQETNRPSRMTRLGRFCYIRNRVGFKP
jgi:hypothetical protein